VIETSKQWAFTAVALGLSLAASYAPLTRTPPPFTGPAAAVRPPHRPSPGPTDAPLRDPFSTGAEWRARMREKLQPQFPANPTPASPSPVETAPVEVIQDTTPVLEGTAIVSATQRFAVLEKGYYPEGAMIGKYKIVRVELDQVVFSIDGRRVVVKVPGRTTSVPTRSTTTSEP
jgi:hypothetical protein